MLEEIFQELNHLHFAAELPLPKLRWNPRLSSSAGRFCPGSRMLIASRAPEIEVASYLRELPDGAVHVRDTMLHEMIHYFLWHRRRPYGHTAEFHEILRRVGAKRYNTVPKERPPKHWYECPHCRKGFPARRRLGVSACAVCCERFNQGRYHERFRLVRMEPSRAAAPARVPALSASSLPPSPARREEEKRLSPGEVIGRLEELKRIVARVTGPR